MLVAMEKWPIYQWFDDLYWCNYDPYAPCMVYLPTFGWFLGQMLVNIPYIELMGDDLPIKNDDFPLRKRFLTGDDQRDQTGSNPHFFKRHVFGWIGTTPSCSSKTSGADMGQGDQVPYPLVNIQKTMERSTMLLMGKLTISTGPFSIAMLVITWG